jgi:hypothetical protein
MRRRTTRRQTVPHPFSGSDMNALQNVCGKLFHRSLQMYPAPTMSHDEFCRLFINPDHREAFRIASAFAKMPRYYREDAITYRWPLRDSGKVDLAFKLMGNASTLVPNEPKIQADAPHGVVNAIDEWLNQRLQLGVDWGRVLACVDAMNTQCRTSTQVRYLWPSILSLTKIAGLDSSAKIEEYKEPSVIPTLDPGLRAALQKTAGTIATAALLNDPPEFDLDGKVQITYNGSRQILEDGLSPFVAM